MSVGWVVSDERAKKEQIVAAHAKDNKVVHQLIDLKETLDRSNLGLLKVGDKVNVVLMSQHFMMGEWSEGLRYLFPLLAFAVGVFVAERIQGSFKYARKLHWRQSVLLCEMAILVFVGFLPENLNMAATVLVSFSCAMQVQTFRKVGGYSYASTMCIGNLRSGTAAFSLYLREKRPEQIRQAFYYFGIILFFAVGAGIGGNLSVRYGFHVLWISGGLLLISFLLMFLEKIR